MELQFSEEKKIGLVSFIWMKKQKQVGSKKGWEIMKRALRKKLNTQSRINDV